MGFSLLLGSASFPNQNAVTPSPAAAPAAPSHPVTLTAYNAVPEQTDGNPFETASGAYSNPEVVAARSQDLGEELPFGTIIEIDGSDITNPNGCGYDVVAEKVGYRVIADTMNKKFTDRLDVLLDTKAEYRTADQGMQNAAEVMGICKGITYRVVGYVDINHMPKTQGELAKLVKGKAGSASLAIK